MAFVVVDERVRREIPSRAMDDLGFFDPPRVARVSSARAPFALVCVACRARDVVIHTQE